MKSFITCITVVVLSSVMSTEAFADGSISAALTALITGQPTTLSPAHITGQPNQSCGSDTAPNTPGNAASAPGSAFNASGTAPSVYAGQQPQNSVNTASVSQYDVACFHQPAF